MNPKMPPVYFYIPQRHWPENLPEDPDLFWKWQGAMGKRNLGIYDLPVQAYMHLKAHGFPCEMVPQIPDEGIVLSHRFWLHDHLRPKTNNLLVCIRGDRPRHPYAQLHIVQNPQQELSSGLLASWDSHYIPHWRQSGLIGRDPNRGDRFENIVYFGFEHNLVEGLRSPEFRQVLADLGLKCKAEENPDKWRDYSDADVVLAIRSFGREIDYSWKPGSKLYQAWAAGVPAIVGYESIFRSEKKSDLDFIEATSTQEVIAALKQLQNDSKLRQMMAENGRVRAKETNPENLVKRWSGFIEEIAVPAYERWRSAPELARQMFLTRRYLAVKVNHVQDRMGWLETPQIDRLKIS
jgi:hypothetical protein